MQVAQIKDLMNQVTNEILGTSNIVNDDLSNVVDLGVQIFNSTSVDNYVKSLVNHIGKVIFVDRVYQGSAPSVLMDAWEFGSVLQKISTDLPQAVENEDWELQHNTSYDPNIFYKPNVSAKFFNSKVTFEIDLSFTELQVKESFSSAEQLNGFLSMLYNSVDKSMTVKIDSLIMRTINNAIGETLQDAYNGDDVTASSGVRAVNLLYLYNTKFSKSLTAAEAITDPDFIKFAAYTMGMYEKRMSKLSTLFNIGGKERFTTTDLLHVVLLSDFAEAANVYLQSNTWHDEYTKLPNAEVVPYWQGTGTAYNFSDVSKINVKTSANNVIEQSGILGVMFDRDALGVSNLDRRVTTNYNPKAEFYTNFYKFDSSYFNDLNENFVVFFVA